MRCASTPPCRHRRRRRRLDSYAAQSARGGGPVGHGWPPMNRRDVLGAIGLTAFAGEIAAQTPGRRPRIGYLGPAADTAPHLVRAFQDGLRELGYVDGRTIAIDYRWTTREGGLVVDPTELLRLARGLVTRPVDVIAASVVPAIAAARQATKSVPIVMMNGSDVGRSRLRRDPGAARRQHHRPDPPHVRADRQEPAVPRRGGAVGAPHRRAGQHVDQGRPGGRPQRAPGGEGARPGAADRRGEGRLGSRGGVRRR